METASLRIKFTPLFNNALKNGSKCCLEIVPEVSCIQNLDKISWKQEKDLMEYTIPMTYKIILKKQDTSNKAPNNLATDELELDKTYHSCVDLLPTSSMATFDFASGDVTKIISDTYVLGKLSAQYNSCKPSIDSPVNAIKANVIETQPHDCPKELPDLKQIDNEQANIPDVFEEEKSDNAIAGHVINDSYEQCVADKYSLDKITNTDNAITVCKITETQSNDTSTDISSRSRDDSKRKLSLSPICSIDTNDNSHAENAEEIPLNLVVDRIFHYDAKEISEDVAFKLPTRNKKHVHIRTLNDNCEEFNENSYKVYLRELPEERVAKFIKKMEIEIMPLKRMLNDILQKCSKLDLSKNKYTARNLVLYKTIPSCKNQVEKCCKTERQAKSNRVVYSVVFEGIMDNESIVEQIVRSLSFEVVAVPQDNIIQLTTTTKSAPLNVKIRVRKKDDAGFQHGVLSMPKSQHPDRIPERVRLVSSDQTIMSFNVVMEADFQKPFKKPRKNMFNIFKPTICLGTRSDEDKYAYLPSKSNKADNNEESTSKSEGTLARSEVKPATLSTKNKNKDIFGKCKPGGCLDPPFGEDRHPYSLTQDDEQKKVTKKTEQTAEPSENKVRKSSTISKKLSNWKRKSSVDEALNKNVIKKETKAEPVLDLYQAGSLQVSATYSHSIMTYPPTINSSEQLRVQDEKQRGSRIYNSPSKNSINVNSGSYFIMPKKTKNVLDKNNTVQMEDDATASDFKVITSKTTLEDKNKIAQDQDMEDDKKKNALQAKDSVTDIRAAEKYAPTDSKNRTGSIQKPLENLATLGIITAIITSTNTAPSESNNAPLEKDTGPKDLLKLENSELTKTEYTEPLNIQSEKDQKSKGPQKYEDTTLIKTKRRESYIILSEKDKESKEPQIYEDTTPTKTEGTESKIVLSEMDKKSKAPQKCEETTLTKTERTESKNILFEKDKESKEPRNFEDTPPTKTERTQSKNILSEQDKVLEKPQMYEDTTYTRTGNAESKTILSEKDKEFKEPQNYDDTPLTNIVRTESKNFLFEKDKVLVEPQKYEDIANTQIESIESNNLPLEKDRVSQEPQKHKDTTYTKTERTEDNIPLEKEVHREHDQNQDLTTQVASMSPSDITTEKQKTVEVKKPDAIDESLSENDSKLNDLQRAEDTPENNVVTKEELRLSETSIKNQKPSSINEPSFDTLQEISDAVLSKIVDETKFGDKGIAIPDGQHKVFTNDFTDTFARSTNINSLLPNEERTNLGDEEPVKIPTPIEKDTPLDIPYDGEDPRYVRENKENTLEPEIQFYSENESNEQRDSFNKYVKPLPELKDLIQDKVNELIPKEFDVIGKNGNKKLESADSQVNTNDSIFEIIDQNEDKLKNTARSAFDTTGSAESQKLEPDMDVIGPEKKNIIGNSVDVNFGQPPVNSIINKDVSQYDDHINEFYVQSDITNHPRKNNEENEKTASSKETTKSETLKEPQHYENKNDDLETIAKQSTNLNEIGDKHIKKITFDDDFKADDDCNKNFTDSGFNLEYKRDNNRAAAATESFEKSFQNEHNQSKAKTPEITRHKARPIMVNFATQSYVDANNHVIIKSFDANNIPKQYKDDVIITKRYVGTDDEIHIPIDTENDMYIYIKNNNKDINELDGCYNDTGITRKNTMEEKSEDELAQIERKVVIADDIRKTLVAVYEQELLPLRNTISELKNNLEMLTANHLLLKGHMFLRKPRSNKIVPLYKKCVCMKK